MAWELAFISEEDFTNHVKATIDKYGEKLESFDIVSTQGITQIVSSQFGMMKRKFG